MENAMTPNGICRSCKKPLYWITVNKTGKKNPLDPEPDLLRGNVRIINDQAFILHNEAAEHLRERGEALYLSHFSTCPHSPKQHKN
jgi:hypothetical protein